jgi:hypothetical protein
MMGHPVSVFMNELRGLHSCELPGTLCLSNFYTSTKPLLPAYNSTILFTNTFCSTLFFKSKLNTPVCFKHLNFHAVSKNVN